MMRKLLAAGMAATALLGLTAGTASAKSDDTYMATIDCGAGPVDVASTDDLFAPLVELTSSRRYKPIAWNVVVDGREIQANKGHSQHGIECRYDDGVALGTVVVKN
jgi:hypothetical protein